MPEEQPTKRCFVIGPIGEPGTDVRRKADWLLKGIIRPVLIAAPFNYLVRRADDFPEPGMITGQVINAILEWDLVVADLTGPNANAFYELALRHMAEKPAIHFIDSPHKPPFDVSDYRTIPYSVEDYETVEDAKVQLRAQVEAVEAPDYELSNPVTKARGYQRLAQSSDPTEQMVAGIVEKLAILETKLEQLNETKPRAPSYFGGITIGGVPSQPPNPTGGFVSGFDSSLPGGLGKPVNVTLRHPPPPRKK